MMRLKNKVAIITGATSGIGKATALLFAEEGANLVVTGRRSELGKALEAECRQRLALSGVETGVGCVFVEADHSKLDDCQRVVDVALKEFNQIDILFNNAGICADGQFYKMSGENWDHVTDTNINSLYNVTQPVVKQMMKQSETSYIYSMTSTAGMYGVFGQTNYSASKAAVTGFTYALAEEVKRFNIQVNAVSPAAKTDMTIPAIQRAEEECARKGEPFPDYWRIGSSEQVATRITRLIDSAKTPTGTVFGINGEQVWAYHQPEKSEYVI